jgi:hypothetical protein
MLHSQEIPMSRKTKLLLALCVLTALVACSSAPPRPTGAGSTAALRLLRDWRGVWSGKVRDSPMGAMAYTLYVEEAGSAIRARMAPQREYELESMRHEYTLLNFDRGVPVVRFSLTQRNSTSEGELVYQEELSTDDEAVFCPADLGCVQVKVAFVRIDDRAVSVRTWVDESRHAEVGLRFASSQIPKAGAEIEPVEPVKSEPQVQPARKNSGDPLDEDVYLEEHVDQDITESSAGRD